MTFVIDEAALLEAIINASTRTRRNQMTIDNLLMRRTWVGMKSFLKQHGLEPNDVLE